MLFRYRELDIDRGEDRKDVRLQCGDEDFKKGEGKAERERSRGVASLCIESLERETGLLFRGRPPRVGTLV